MKKLFYKIIIFFLIVSVGLVSFFMEKKSTCLNATKGILDVTALDFQKIGPVCLNGQWEVYENMLLEPKDLAGKVPDGYFNIPGPFKNKTNNSTSGFMTIRLRINADNNVVYGLRIKSLLSSYRVWVNGVLQSEAGSPGKSFNEEKAIFLPSYSYFTAKDGVIDLLIETSNFRDLYPIISSMEFGTKHQIMNKYLLGVSFDLFIISGLFIIEFISIFLFIRNKSNKSLLYFCILCLFIQLRCIFLNERVIVQIFPNMPFELLSKIAAITFYLWIPFYVLFLKEQFNNVSKKLIYISAAFGAVFGLICLFTNNTFYDKLSFLSQGILLIIVLMVFKFFFDKVKDNDQNALVSLYAFVILSATAINDILVNNGISYGKYLFQLGMFIFALIEVYILSVKYSKELIRVRKLEVINKRIYENSIRDGLTGLYNRSYMDKILSGMIKNYIRKDISFSVIMLDIDNFKAINDNYGHVFGDKVLTKVAEAIRENLRYNDYAGRYGGEEFIILLSNTDIYKAVSIAESIRKNIESLSWKHKAKVTISGGVYENISLKKTEAIDNADKLLYKAKANGKNQICYSESI